jgi:hypothetical protein
LDPASTLPDKETWFANTVALSDMYKFGRLPDVITPYQSKKWKFIIDPARLPKKTTGNIRGSGGPSSWNP